MSALDARAVGEVDRSDQTADVLDLGNQLRDALWRVESARLEPRDTPGGLIVAGVGGSAVGGMLARAALGDRASRPIAIVRDYALPPWATPDTTVLCASYSGKTEEALACFDAAGVLGARRIVVTTGGPLADLAREEVVPVIPMPAGIAPRSAVAYLTVAALEVAALCGAAPGVRSEVDVAAAYAEELAAEWGPDGAQDGLAKALARALHGSAPVVIGAGLTAPVAYRWKTQVNENAEQPCHAGCLPELCHNEIAGWSGARDVGRYTAVFLSDPDLHPRVRERIELTRRLIEPHAVGTHLIEGHGESRIARVTSLVLLGDLVSIYMAVLRGVDPAPVAVLDELKSALGASRV